MKYTKLYALVLIIVMLCGCQEQSPQTTTVPTTLPSGTTAESTLPPTTAAPITHVEVMREGEYSKIPVELVQGVVGEYTIAMDPEYFTFVPMKNMDLFLYADWPGKTVCYSVMPYSGSFNRVDFENYCMDRFGDSYADMSSQICTVGEYEALRVTFSTLVSDPSYCRTVLLLNCGDSLWLIQAEYVTEMLEGLVPIMEALFTTFQAEP